MAETKHVRIPMTVYVQADALKDEYGYASIGEAIRHMCVHGDYDV